MSRPLPTWAQDIAPVDANGAAVLLGVSMDDLRQILSKHPQYEQRGRKKVFYPEHIRKLKYILAPPTALTPIEVIRNHVAASLPAGALVQFEQFISQEFDGNVYLIRCNDRIKIGFTTHWTRRYRVLKTACPYPVAIIAVMPGNRIFEQFLHVAFDGLRRHGEWFDEKDDLATMVAAIEALPK